MTASASDIIFDKTAELTSAGGVDSGVPITASLNSFFPLISEVDRIAGGMDIKKWCGFNNHATDDWTLPAWWFDEPTDETHYLGLGLDDGDDDDNDQGVMTDWSGNAFAAVISNGADTRTLTVTGLDDTGAVATEALVLTGAVQVVGAQLFSVVYSVTAATQDGARTVTVKEGAGGTTRGTIPPNRKLCWLWVPAISEGAGIWLANLPATTAHCFWHKRTWPAAEPGHRPNTLVLNSLDH